MAYRRRRKNEIRPFACFYLRWIIKCYFAAEMSRSNDQPVYDVPPFYADHVFDLMRGAWSPFFDFCRLFVTTVKLARWNGSASGERRCITVNCYRCIRSGFYRFFFFLHCVYEVYDRRRIAWLYPLQKLTNLGITNVFLDRIVLKIEFERKDDDFLVVFLKLYVESSNIVLRFIQTFKRQIVKTSVFRECGGWA